MLTLAASGGQTPAGATRASRSVRHVDRAPPRAASLRRGSPVPFTLFRRWEDTINGFALSGVSGVKTGDGA